MYSFNEPTLIEALIRAKARGVTLRVIMDALQAGNATSQADALRKAGVTVKLMRCIKGNGIMHHKVAIYDRASFRLAVLIGLTMQVAAHGKIQFF